MKKEISVRIISVLLIKKPPPISGIAIMTGSDDTGEQSVSYSIDIVMESE
jgi:hypothetical protein